MPVHLAKGITLVHVDGRKEVRIYWRSVTRPLFLIIPALWVAAAVWVLPRPSKRLNVIHKILIGATAIVLAGFLLVYLVNSTRLYVHGGLLHVTHGPFPVRSRKSVPLDRVARLTMGRLGFLQAELTDGERIMLVDNLDSLPKTLDRIAAGKLGLEERKQKPTGPYPEP